MATPAREPNASGHPTRFGALIRAHRKAVSMSQAELAETLGVQAQTISQWERGAKRPQPRFYRSLVDFLGLENQSDLREILNSGTRADGDIIMLHGPRTGRAANANTVEAAAHDGLPASTGASPEIGRSVGISPGLKPNTDPIKSIQDRDVNPTSPRELTRIATSAVIDDAVRDAVARAIAGIEAGIVDAVREALTDVVPTSPSQDPASVDSTTRNDGALLTEPENAGRAAALTMINGRAGKLSPTEATIVLNLLQGRTRH